MTSLESSIELNPAGLIGLGLQSLDLDYKDEHAHKVEYMSLVADPHLHLC